MRLRRFLGLTLALFALTTTIGAVPATAATAGRKWNTVPNVMAWGRTLEWGGFQVSGDFMYGHSPGGGDYGTKGSWPSGTVLEARAYYVERGGDGKVNVVTKWRTRRGTTAILSDWNLGGSNSSTRSYYHSYTTGSSYGYRDDFGDALGTSAVTIQSYFDCSTVAGVDSYSGATFDVTANPSGSDTVSGLHDQGAAFQENNIMDCGEQA